MGTRRSAAAAAVLGGMLATAPASSAEVLWQAGAERPFAEEFASFSCESASRISQVAAPGANGRAYRLEVRDGDDSWGERCELAQGNPTRPGFPLHQQGDDQWISWRVYLPSSYPTSYRGSFNVTNQWKQLGGLGTPALSMEVRYGQWRLMSSTTNRDSNRTFPRWSGPAVTERWVEFTLHVRFSPWSDGFVELYGDLDGLGQRLLLPRTSTWTMKLDGGRVAPSHTRFGPYRDSRISGTTYVLYDDYTVATSKSSAEAGAFGTTPQTLDGTSGTAPDEASGALGTAPVTPAQEGAPAGPVPVAPDRADD